MSTPLSPAAALTPNSYSVSGTPITARVSVGNRPAYSGKPAITGLATITPKINISRTPTGVAPFLVYVSGLHTTSNAGDAYGDLDYRWDFGDASGTETFTDQWNGKTVNANTDQMGPEAAYIYRTAGTYTITLTVTGKDANGDLVTASTTTLMTVGQHYIFLANATGGTYTLTFNGQTTAVIAYNATKTTVLAALQALSNLDTTNVDVCNSGNIKFVGEFVGQSYTFTGDFTSLTGTSGTAQIITHQASDSFTDVSVVAESTLDTQYFDSNYDGGNGAPDGTSTRPYTAIANLRSWCLGANRLAVLETGSDWTMTAHWSFIQDMSTIRIATRGSGAKPIIRSGGFQIKCDLTWGSASYPTGWFAGDVVFTDVDIRDSSSAGFLRMTCSSNGNTSYPYAMATDIVFDRCDYLFTSSGIDGGLLSSVMVFSRGMVFANIGVWNCDLDCGLAGGQAIFPSQDQHFVVMGGSIVNGDGDLNFDHHIYSNVFHHQLYRWVNFGAGSKSYVVNANASSSGGASRAFLADGCNITGTQNGFDFSNSNNDYASGHSGYFDDVILQFCPIHSGQINTQQHGIFCYNLAKITLRDNMWWDNNSSHFSSADVTKPTLWSIYRNVFFDGVCNFRTGQIAYLHDNVFVTETTSRPCVSLNADATPSTDVPLWDADGNVYYAPNSTSPFRTGTSTPIAVATWQGYGADATSTFDVDPEFPDGGAGVFKNAPTLSIDWPAGFTSLEYSLDDGDNWSAYTNGSDQSIGATLTGWQEVLFRAVTDAGTTVTITGDSKTDNVWISTETFSAILTSHINRVYYAIRVGSLHLVLQAEE